MSLHAFIDCFIPLLVAMDPLGLVPIFLSVTPGISEGARRRLTYEALAASVLICFGFMLLGQATFRVLGIDVNDFRVAGGIVLLVLAVLDLISHGKPAVDERAMVGIVPLATPLIAGPATLTTILVVSSNHGYVPASLALVANFGLLLVTMCSASRVARVIGTSAMEALSKLVMILLAAIAVNFIRSGVVEIVKGVRGVG